MSIRQDILNRSIKDWKRTYDAIPEFIPFHFVDDNTGNKYDYSSKAEAVQGLYNEDLRLGGEWAPYPADDNDVAAWAVVEMLVDAPSHVGLPGAPWEK